MYREKVRFGKDPGIVSGPKRSCTIRIRVARDRYRTLSNSLYRILGTSFGLVRNCLGSRFEQRRVRNWPGPLVSDRLQVRHPLVRTSTPPKRSRVYSYDYTYSQLCIARNGHAILLFWLVLTT